MKMFKIVEKKNLWLTFSGALILLCIVTLGFRAINGVSPFNLGIDFTGGSSLVFRVEKLAEITALEDAEQKSAMKKMFLADVRGTLLDFNIDKSTVLLVAGKTNGDADLSIKTVELKADKRQAITASLEEKFGEMELLEADIIGPSIGEELAKQSFQIALLAVVCLLIYITFRFEFFFGVAAIGALIHDALITIGLAGLLNLEVNTAFVAAVLTILGYSINDTIVIFDRVRENMPLMKKEGLDNTINISIRQSIARSVNTSLTTLVVLGSILLFGGESIKNFALVIFIGIISGTYSSIFIASPLLAKYKKWQDS